MSPGIIGRSCLATLATWQLNCLAEFICYRATVGRLVVATYTAMLGDIQSSYETYDRVAEHVGQLITTTTATLASLWLFRLLTKRRATWSDRVRAFGAWEATVMIVLICRMKSGFRTRSMSWIGRLLALPTISTASATPSRIGLLRGWCAQCQLRALSSGSMHHLPALLLPNSPQALSLRKINWRSRTIRTDYRNLFYGHATAIHACGASPFAVRQSRKRLVSFSARLLVLRRFRGIS